MFVRPVLLTDCSSILTCSATRRSRKSSSSLAPQRHVDDRDVVDLDRLDDPARHRRRRNVLVHRNLVVQLDQAVFAILADVEADRDHGHVRARHGIDVFHAVDLVQQTLQVRGHLLLDFRGAGTGNADHHVGQRHDNLRFLFARSHVAVPPPRDQREENHQHRQVAVQKYRHDAGHKTLVLVVFMRCFNRLQVWLSYDRCHAAFG